MDCRLKYSKDITDDIYSIVGIDRTSAKLIKGNEILLPVGGIDNSNNRLKTKNNTYKWATSVAKSINDRYQSSLYGTVVTVDNTSSEKGTLLHITIPKLLIDAIEVKNDQREMETLRKDMEKRDLEGNQKFNEEGDVYFQTGSTGTQPDAALKTLLLEFCKKNGVKVEFIDDLLTKHGNDYTAVYDVLNKTISVAKGRESLDTLPEEVGHALLEGLGDNHVLVSRLYKLISGYNYKSQLDPEYLEAYHGNEAMMIKEYAGQALGEAITKSFKGDTQIKTILDRIIDLLLSLFRKSSSSELSNIKTEIDKITSTLANKVLSGEKIDFVTPINPSKFYQVNKPVYDEKYTKHLRLLQRRVRVLELRLKNIKDKESANYKRTHTEIEALKTEIASFKKTGDVDILFKIGTSALEAAKDYIIKLETGAVQLTADKSDDWEYTEYIISTFKDFKGLRETAGELEDRLLTVSKNIVKDLVNSHKAEKNDLDYEDIMNQKSDINRFTMGTGALVDLGDYLARTIGSLIKAAQNKISTFQKKLADDIKVETDLVRKWAKANGVSEEDMFNIFIQQHGKSTSLTKIYNEQWYKDVKEAYKAKNFSWIENNSVKDENGKLIPINKKKYLNPNYTKIQSTPELKRFYEFYNKNISEAFDKLPVSKQSDFIPNVFTQTLNDIIKTSPTITSKLKDGVSAFTEVSTSSFKEGDYSNDEDIDQDVIPFKYLKPIDSSKKSNNLAEVLYKFGAFAESHQQLSDVLPKARLLQKHIQKKKYQKSSDPHTTIAGLNTNLNHMVEKVIDMQLKGNKSLKELKLPVGGVYDENGKRVGDKFIHGSDVIDFGLRYNSLLRIGLNPLNATVNVIIGDIGNIIEGFGGRFYNMKNLKDATNIYSSQRLAKKSKLRNVMTILNPLQELEDYQHSEDLKFKKKIDIDKAKNYMYAPQRMGEDFLQTRTMIAIMLKTTIPGTKVPVWEALNEDGSLKKEYNNNFKSVEEYNNFLNSLTDKIQRVNQMIHGRYSERDAATIQQSVLWRMVFQFKKWIPAAIEQRLGKSQFDVRLETDIEGRWRTAYRLFTKSYLEKSLESLKTGNMTETEIYNMRKNLTELVIIAGVMLTVVGFGWDDDDKRSKDPSYKMAMTLLNRVSGDLLFFADPRQANRLVKSPVSLSNTVGDLLKVFETIPYALSSETDARKTSLPERIAKITPGAKPSKEVFDFFNEERYREYTGG